MWFLVYGAWALTGLSLLGAVLNTLHRISGFYVWIVENTCWCVYFAYLGLWPSFTLFLAYDLLSAWGIVVWRRDFAKAAQADDPKSTGERPWPSSWC